MTEYEIKIHAEDFLAENFRHADYDDFLKQILSEFGVYILRCQAEKYQEEDEFEEE